MSTPLHYFEGLYAAAEDPWNFTDSWYDQRKHALTVASLPRRRYRSAFEPGCSTGMLTHLLAARCDRLLAVDAVESAATTAAERLGACPHVRVARGQVPDDWPEEQFDLIVLSELIYYFDDLRAGRLIDQTITSLAPGGDLVTVHWRWPVPQHVRSADEVQRELAGRTELTRTVSHREADFYLDVYSRTPPAARSVAQREGRC
ncbi:class I SAM-dependent DNA methyltransferase [Micromonospora sp. NPDC005806]|uniref:class I SAM-dependent DNA methyltransferase n=1 Tax=Micromonospora sp. NPDC005806 TaxID=3364234 RepID=UPI0036AD4B43